MITLTSPLRKATPIRLATAIGAMMFLARVSFAGIQTMVGHNVGEQETSNFTFTNVPPPSRNDAATGAKFTVLSGTADSNGGDLEALHNGQLPAEADSPAENFFFEAGSVGGRIQVDLGRDCEIKQVNTYSWHPSTRGPQVYKLYASTGTEAGFNAKPAKDADIEKSGWKLIAQVDTKSSGEIGGQYGVSISDTDGIIGKYHYLLFDIAPSETDDAFGNTFYSEIDVVELNAPVEAATLPPAPPLVVQSADDYCTITIDTSKAPALREWAEQKLAPALVEWYPKIVAMMPSEGFVAPKKFTVEIKPVNGVAYTSGTRIVANSAWLGGQLKGEAVGAIVHEEVHVVQQYGNGWRTSTRAPGWFTEGLPDYIRFFKFEPQSHGADSVWLQRHPPRKFNYDGLYRISANFLNYVVEHYDPDKKVIEKVNAVCRQGKYTDAIWKELTGKSLAELNEEWKLSVYEVLAKKPTPSS